MPNKCCVPFCNTVGGFTFPKDKKLCEKWIHLVKRNGKGDHWKPSQRSIVCGKHFVDEDFCSGPTSKGALVRRKRMLKPGATPSLFPWSVPKSEAALKREQRQQKRRKQKVNLGKDNQGTDSESCATAAHNEVIFDDDIVIEEEVSSGDPNSSLDSSACGLLDKGCSTDNIEMVDCGTQLAKQELPTLCVERLEFDTDLLHYFTGLESWGKFVTVFQTLGPSVNFLRYHRTGSVTKISPMNQFLLMLAKLRQDMDYLLLTKLAGVSIFTAENIFVTWVNFCSRQWGELNLWPSRELVSFFAPSDFKAKFPTTRVVIDGTEIPIEKPSLPTAQRATFSSYKNKNTVKCLVGASPGGLVSFVSPVYGGSASDRQITERSNLMERCSPGDSVMADKGFNVQDLFAMHDVQINIPSFFTKKNRMSGIQVIHDRKISSKRVHIERVIGNAKTYKILVNGLNGTEVTLARHIISVCFMLCNFRSNIVPTDA